MTTTIDALKTQFKDGHREEAIATCEGLCAQSPTDASLLKLCSTMHAVAGNYQRSLALLQQARHPEKEDADILFNLGVCERELKNFASAANYFDVFNEKFPGSADGVEAARECHFKAGLAHIDDGKPAQAVDSFRNAIKLAPHDGPMLKEATLALLESGRGNEALALCNMVLKTQPENLVAKQGAEWILSKLVPLWHVPMMNEYERNKAFHDGLAAHVTPDKVVFEIGAGSGLLAMMAAKLGAKNVVTCEAVSLIAETARKIVERNGFKSQVTVLSKPSSEVQIGADLPAKADILVHEIFSSELLGEHVLPAIEDAKARLLKPGGVVLPGAASVMIALVGGDVLGKNLYVDESFGFDLRAFNTINPRKRPIYREDLAPVLMSDAVEAFRFDFAKSSTFPAAKREIAITSKQAGRCYGVIQWIRVDMVKGVRFENHPGEPRDVSNWQHTIYSFLEPLELVEGSVVSISATHDRARPWFELAPKQ